MLAITGVVLVGQGPLGNILLGTGRHRLVAFVSLGEAVANLLLSVVLVRRYGLLGVAVGTGIPVVIANLFILAPAACRQLGVRVGDFARAVAVAPLVGAPDRRAWRRRASALWWAPQSIPAILVEGTLVGIVQSVRRLDVRLRSRGPRTLQRVRPPSVPYRAAEAAQFPHWHEHKHQRRHRHV